MKTKQISGIAIFFLILLALPFTSSAEKCSKLDVAPSQTNIVLGSNPQTIQFSMNGRGGPMSPWLDYKNATVSVSIPGVTNLSQPLVDITSISGAVHDWNFNVTNSGTYNFSVTAFNTTTECSNSALFTATSVSDPVLSASMTDLTEELKANVDNSGFSVNVNNSGLGNAIDVVIKVQTNVFSELVKTISNLSAGSSTSVPFIFTPTSCALTPLDVSIEYKDESGEEKTPLSLSDTFSVNGSDLVINQLNISSSSVTEGGSVSFSALVNNTEKINSTGFNLTFYKNSISGANKIAEIVSTDSIGSLETKTVPASWTSSGSGSHNIIAVAKSASGECNTTNSQKTVSLTVNAVTPPSGGTTTDTGTGPSDNRITTPTSTPIKTSIPIVPSSLKATPTTSTKETQTIGTINSGETKTASFSKSSDLNIQQISITAKNSATSASVNVEKEKEKPASVTVPIGDVHSYLTITTSVKNEDISTAKVTFKLEKSWLNSNSIDKNKVSLNRFTAQWDKLATTLLSEDDNFAYYGADTPGFSVFSITGEKLSPAPTTEAVTGGGGPSGLFLGGQSNILILVVMVIIAGLIFFLYKRKKR